RDAAAVPHLAGRHSGDAQRAGWGGQGLGPRALRASGLAQSHPRARDGSGSEEHPVVVGFTSRARRTGRVHLAAARRPQAGIVVPTASRARMLALASLYLAPYIIMLVWCWSTAKPRSVATLLLTTLLATLLLMACARTWRRFFLSAFPLLLLSIA